MITKDSKRLVIDADVAQASGSETATHPRAKQCRDFLQTVLSVCHRVVMTKTISNEWNSHQSRFARLWRKSMYARRKVVDFDSIDENIAIEYLTKATNNQNEIDNMQKDIHLLQAAMGTDQMIISLDETVRKLFAEASEQVGEIRFIIWVNPEKSETEQPITWLKTGASPETHRQLSNYQME